MQRLKFLLVVNAILLGDAGVCAERSRNEVYHYEPSIITLSGVIERHEFPGPPNYESIKGGDRIEKGWYLRLVRPIDVERSPEDDNPLSDPEAEKNVKILQLTWEHEGETGGVIKKHVGNEVFLKGHLFHGWSSGAQSSKWKAIGLEPSRS